MKLPPPPSSVTGPLRDYLNTVFTVLRSDQPVSTFTTTTSDFTLSDEWHRLRVTATSLRTVYLPNATRYLGWVYQIKSTLSSTNTVVVRAATGQIVEGAQTQSLITAGASLTLQSYGNGWDLL